MPVYKDKLRNTWWVKTRVRQNDGTLKQVVRRGFKKKSDAQDMERVLKLGNAESNLLVMFDEVSAHYLEDLKRKVKETTYIDRKSIVLKHLNPKFKNMRMNKITAKIIRDLQNEWADSDKSVNTQKKYFTVLSSIFKHGMMFFDLKSNPCTIAGGIKLKTEPTDTIMFWTPEEFNHFYGCIDKLKWEAVFMLAYYSGARRGEICALQWNDLNDVILNINKTLTLTEKGTVIGLTTKTGIDREIKLPYFVVEKLLEYKKECIKTFPRFNDKFFMFGDKENFLSKSTIDKAFRRYKKEYQKKCESNEIPDKFKNIRLHDLRHSNASLLISLGVKPTVIAKRLGHANAETTLKIYTHMFPADEDEAVSAMEKIGK